MKSVLRGPQTWALVGILLFLVRNVVNVHVCATGFSIIDNIADIILLNSLRSLWDDIISIFCLFASLCTIEAILLSLSRFNWLVWICSLAWAVETCSFHVDAFQIYIWKSMLVKKTSFLLGSCNGKVIQFCRWCSPGYILKVQIWNNHESLEAIVLSIEWKHLNTSLAYFVNAKQKPSWEHVLFCTSFHS